MAANTRLFTQFNVGSSQLQHRIVMAPMTRFRADGDHVPTPMMVEYYNQRACSPGTLIFTEAIFISRRASGYANVPGLYTNEQLSGWKAVTDAVHSNGSKIWAQLWALGRTADSKVLEEQEGMKDAFVSSSAVRMDESSPTPRELTEEEIQSYVQDYAQAAKNAIEKGGFDGVEAGSPSCCPLTLFIPTPGFRSYPLEIHGANGYLVDQFIQDTCNNRQDRYGGSVENRARFALEVAKAVADTVGSDKTGIRLSPWSTFQGMGMKDPVPQFTYIIKGLKVLDLAYIHVIDSRENDDTAPAHGNLDFALQAWGREKPVLINGGLTPASAVKAVEMDYKDYNVGLVFGRSFLSTPDLVYRIQKGIEPNSYDRNTFYTPGSIDGYTTYPFSKEFMAESKA